MKNSLLFVLLICGCTSVSVSDHTKSKSNASSHSSDTVIWTMTYTAKVNKYTIQTYRCIIEMDSFAYKPIDSGPACRDSCALYRDINTMVDSAPSYIENPARYRIRPSAICDKSVVNRKNSQVKGNYGTTQ